MSEILSEGDVAHYRPRDDEQSVNWVRVLCDSHEQLRANADDAESQLQVERDEHAATSMDLKMTRAELERYKTNVDIATKRVCEVGGFFDYGNGGIGNTFALLSVIDVLAEKVKGLEAELNDANYWRKRHSDEAEIYAQRSVSTFNERKQLAAKLARAEEALRRLVQPVTNLNCDCCRVSTEILRAYFARTANESTGASGVDGHAPGQLDERRITQEQPTQAGVEPGMASVVPKPPAAEEGIYSEVSARLERSRDMRAALMKKYDPQPAGEAKCGKCGCNSTCDACHRDDGSCYEQAGEGER